MKVVIIDDDKNAGLALADLLETRYDMEVLGHALCALDGLALLNKHQTCCFWMFSCRMSMDWILSTSCRRLPMGAVRW